VPLEFCPERARRHLMVKVASGAWFLAHDQDCWPIMLTSPHC